MPIKHFRTPYKSKVNMPTMAKKAVKKVIPLPKTPESFKAKIPEGEYSSGIGVGP